MQGDIEGEIPVFGAHSACYSLFYGCLYFCRFVRNKVKMSPAPYGAELGI